MQTTHSYVNVAMEMELGGGGKPVLWHHLGKKNNTEAKNYYYNESVAHQMQEPDGVILDDSEQKGDIAELHLDEVKKPLPQSGVSQMKGGCPSSIDSAIVSDSSSQTLLLDNRCVLDFAIQIARGMEHLERMKVSY